MHTSFDFLLWLNQSMISLHVIKELSCVMNFQLGGFFPLPNLSAQGIRDIENGVNVFMESLSDCNLFSFLRLANGCSRVVFLCVQNMA